MRKDIRELLDKMADMFMEEPALEKPKKYTIYVNASCLFGGVDIK